MEINTFPISIGLEEVQYNVAPGFVTVEAKIFYFL